MKYILTDKIKYGIIEEMYHVSRKTIYGTILSPKDGLKDTMRALHAEDVTNKTNAIIDHKIQKIDERLRTLNHIHLARAYNPQQSSEKPYDIQSTQPQPKQIFLNQKINIPKYDDKTKHALNAYNTISKY